MYQEPDNPPIILVDSIFLLLAFDEIAVEGSFQDWWIVAGEVFVDNDGFGISTFTGINGDEFLRVSSEFYISQSWRWRWYEKADLKLGFFFFSTFFADLFFAWPDEFVEGLLGPAIFRLLSVEWKVMR